MSNKSHLFTADYVQCDYVTVWLNLQVRNLLSSQRSTQIWQFWLRLSNLGQTPPGFHLRWRTDPGRRAADNPAPGSGTCGVHKVSRDCVVFERNNTSTTSQALTAAEEEWIIFLYYFKNADNKQKSSIYYWYSCSSFCLCSDQYLLTRSMDIILMSTLVFFTDKDKVSIECK